MARSAIVATFVLSVCLLQAMGKGPDIDYDELLALVEQKAVQLFDVREPNELQETGRIPTAINIPVASFKTEFELSDLEFKSKYGVNKPTTEDTNVVVYCRSGRRAGVAQASVEPLGYTRVRNYVGSMLDWLAHNGPVAH